MAEQIKTITVDGVEHEIEKFSKEVQQLVSVYQRWEVKQIEARLDLALVDAAIRDLNRELTAKIKEALEAEATETTEEVVEEAQAPE